MYNQDTKSFAKFSSEGVFIELTDSHDLQDGVDSEVMDDGVTVYRIYKKTPENDVECPHNCWPTYSDTPELLVSEEESIAVFPMTLVLKEGKDLETAVETTSVQVREKRNTMLTDCDYVVLRAYESGGSVSTDWSTYRQALRDIPQHNNFPFLTASDWPAAPE